MSFIEKLDAASLEVFNEACSRPYPQQCVFFLNAFWEEAGDQAEFVYAISNSIFRLADMNAKGIQYIHLYQEGTDLDFDLGLYFFEQLCKFAENPNHEFFKKELGPWVKSNPEWATTYKRSIPAMQTSIVRKKELREKVDVNFDGRVSMLEFLLYQYECSPKDLIIRSLGNTGEHEEIKKARLALEAVNKAIAAYEAEKSRLTAESEQPGVRGKKAINELAQLNSGPLWETLNKTLITAEAAVRIAIRKYGKGGASAGPVSANAPKSNASRTDGALWWMARDLKEKQDKYGKHTNALK